MGLNSGIGRPVVYTPGGSALTGVPLGPYANWAALPVSGTAGALATVTSIGPGNATGTAIWDGTEWELYRGIFDSVADLEAFAGPIQTGGVGSVEETGDTNENQVVYVYDGAAWARSAALSTGYVWPLTVVQAVSGIRPVGSQDGDYGVISTANGPVLLRLKVNCALGYGGTRDAWISPTAYEGTPVLQMWTVGTEPNSGAGGLTSQGWTVVKDPGCDVVATGGFQRLSATSATPAAASLRGMLGAVTSSTRIECLCEIRTSTAAPGTLMWAMGLQDGVRATYVGQDSTLGFGFLDTFGAPLNNPKRNNTSPNLPTLAQDPAVLLIRDEGRTVQSLAFQNAQLVGDYQRNLVNSSGNVVLIYQLAGSGIAGTGITDFRGQYVTY